MIAPHSFSPAQLLLDLTDISATVGAVALAAAAAACRSAAVAERPEHLSALMQCLTTELRRAQSAWAAARPARLAAAAGLNRTAAEAAVAAAPNGDAPLGPRPRFRPFRAAVVRRRPTTASR